MTDIFSKVERSRIMSSIRSRNTKFELSFLRLLSAALHSKGYRYRKHYRGLTGTPDVVFVGHKVAIFLDSDFWHGRNYSSLKPKLKNDFWRKKIERNIQRDREVSRSLRRQGWIVLRFWGRDLKKNSSTAIRKIEKALMRQAA